MIRVLLVDDHPVVRTGYARLLEQAGDVQVVAEADSAEQAVARLQNGPAVDVVITDLAMPGAGGLALIRRIMAHLPHARVLVFSMHDSAALVQRAIDVGALGFVAKSSPPEVLVHAVREVHAGRRALQVDPTGAQPSAADWLASPPPRSTESGDRERLAELTERELALFRLLAQGHALSDCARQLGLSPKTASNYQTLIRDKLGVATSAALVHFAIRCGVISPSGADPTA